MSNLNGGLSGSGLLRGALGGGGVAPPQDVYWDDILDKPDFATVATSGSYNDLTDKPTIPAAQVNADWNATSGVAEILNKPTLANVATSGSYNDLTDTPTIPPAQVNADWNATSGVAEILNKPTIPTTASQISYDNTTSGLTSTDTQEAIDENAAEITELKSNLTQLDGLNVVKRITTPASVVSFSDGSNLPMYKLEIEIDNVSGCTEANVSVSGVNIWDEEWELDGNYRLSSKNYIPVKPNTTYLFCNTMLYSITGFDINKNNVGGPSLTQVPNVGYTFTTKSNWAYIKFNVGNSYGNTYHNDISINYPSTDTSYHAYNGQTYNIQFKDGSNPLTVYSGTLDIITGLLTVNDTTPPTYYNLSPISATTLTGVNNIYCDTGNILEVDYTAILNFS